MSEKVVEVQNISKSFVGVQALNEVSLSIEKGEIRTLIGENGSGKSTLIKIIAGVYESDSGKIFIKGERMEDFRPIEAINKGIQVIYQDLSLFPNLSVAENIVMPSQLADGRSKIDWTTIYGQAQEVVREIDLDVNLKAKVENLSMADRQLVAVGRALLRNADLIIMDEPTDSLTRKEIQELFEIIRNLKERDISTFFVSHQMNEVLEISDTITILRDGEKVEEGPVEQFDLDSLKFHLTGRELEEEEKFTYKKSANPEPLMEVENLSKDNKFDNVDFKLRPEEILGITGLLGSGRTDLALALYGVNPADSGEIKIQGKTTNIQSPREAVEHNLAYVPEDRLTKGLALDKSVSENIITSIIDRILNRLGLVDSRRKSSEVNSWIDELEIKTSSPSTPAQSLSGGNQQKVVLAKVMATEPEILLLNFPTFGIDVGTRQKIHQRLRILARNENKGIIIISDDISELVRNCNRILLMKTGQVAKRLNTESLTESDLYDQLVGGLGRESAKKIQ